MKSSKVSRQGHRYEANRAQLSNTSSRRGQGGSEDNRRPFTVQEDRPRRTEPSAAEEGQRTDRYRQHIAQTTDVTHQQRPIVTGPM